AWTRAVHAALGAVAGLAGLTLPAFARHQYVYVGAQDRSHVLLLNLSNVTNRIRTTAVADGATTARRLDAIAPRGAALPDDASLTLLLTCPAGHCIGRATGAHWQDTPALAALIAARVTGVAHVLLSFDRRSAGPPFPYRTHHYPYLKSSTSRDPPLYYAVNATL